MAMNRYTPSYISEIKWLTLPYPNRPITICFWGNQVCSIGFLLCIYTVNIALQLFLFVYFTSAYRNVILVHQSVITPWNVIFEGYLDSYLV